MNCLLDGYLIRSPSPRAVLIILLLYFKHLELLRLLDGYLIEIGRYEAP